MPHLFIKAFFKPIEKLNEQYNEQPYVLHPNSPIVSILPYFNSFFPFPPIYIYIYIYIVCVCVNLYIHMFFLSLCTDMDVCFFPLLFHSMLKTSRHFISDYVSSENKDILLHNHCTIFIFILKDFNTDSGLSSATQSIFEFFHCTEIAFHGFFFFFL